MGRSIRTIITSYEFEWGDQEPVPGINKDCFSFE